jgi:hypothetical protein
LRFVLEQVSIVDPHASCLHPENQHYSSRSHLRSAAAALRPWVAPTRRSDSSRLQPRSASILRRGYSPFLFLNN